MEEDTASTISYKEFLKDKWRANEEISKNLNPSKLTHSSNNHVNLYQNFVTRKLSGRFFSSQQVDGVNKLNHAFVSGLLRSFNDPWLYMWNNGEYLVSPKKRGFPFGLTKIWDGNFTTDMKNTALVYSTFSDKIDKSDKNNVDSIIKGMFYLLSNGGLKYNKIVADLLCKYFFLGFSDRRADNMVYDEKTNQPIEIDFDAHSVNGGKGYFLFHTDEQLEKRECYLQDCFMYINFFPDVLEKLNDENLGKDKNNFSEEKRNELRLGYESFLKTVQQKINDFTLDENKIKEIIKNTAKFGYRLDIGKKDLKEFILENLNKFKTYIDYRKAFLNDKGDQFFKKDIKDMLSKSLKKSGQVLEKVGKSLDKQVNEIVDEYYQHREKDDLKECEKLRKQIAFTVNQHLNKTDPKKQKKLFWDRKGEDKKLMNTRLFFKENAGYIRKINNYYDKMCKEGKQNNREELQKLLSLAKNPQCRPICACY